MGGPLVDFGVLAKLYGLDGALKVASLLGRALESRSAMVWGSGTELSANQVKIIGGFFVCRSGVGGVGRKSRRIREVRVIFLPGSTWEVFSVHMEHGTMHMARRRHNTTWSSLVAYEIFATTTKICTRDKLLLFFLQGVEQLVLGVINFCSE